MKTEKVKVTPVMVYILCPDCDERMEHQEGGFLTSPPRAWYVCPNDHRHMYHDGYPRIEYEVDDENTGMRWSQLRMDRPRRRQTGTEQ